MIEIVDNPAQIAYQMKKDDLDYARFPRNEVNRAMRELNATKEKEFFFATSK